jgi:formiminoglutamase
MRLSTYDANHKLDVMSLPVADLGDDLLPPALSADLTILLGGHNGVTWSALSAAEDLPNWGLLTVDAHHDARNYVPGRVGNGAVVRALIDAGLPGDHVVQVGINGFSNSAEHRRWCEARGVTVLGPERAGDIDRLLEDLSRECNHIYVDLDLDVLDRAFAPGCSGSRPGGLSPGVLFAAAHAAGMHSRVRAIDIVELDPVKDVASITTDSAALALLSAASGYARRTAFSRQSR